MATAAKNTLRQDVWNSAYAVLAAAGYGAAREAADKITARFTEGRATSGVSANVKGLIEADLRAGGMSFAAIRDKHGVGTSTVQRVASEMRAKGDTVRTTGQTNPGTPLS